MIVSPKNMVMSYTEFGSKIIKLLLVIILNSKYVVKSGRVKIAGVGYRGQCSELIHQWAQTDAACPAGFL